METADIMPDSAAKLTDSPIPGSARASRAVSGASPETSQDVQYSKRRLPHFARPWAKYAVAFSTHLRHDLSSAERDIVLQSILYARNHNYYELFVACVTPDHVHLLFEPQPKGQDVNGSAVFWSLPYILHGIKSSSAHRINKLRKTTGTVWEKESFDRIIRSETDSHEKFQYICKNPWVGGIAGPTEDYPWLWIPEICSARAPNSAREARALPGTSNNTKELS
jgi:putative transposase